MRIRIFFYGKVIAFWGLFIMCASAQVHKVENFVDGIRVSLLKSIFSALHYDAGSENSVGICRVVNLFCIIICIIKFSGVAGRRDACQRNVYAMTLCT